MDTNYSYNSYPESGGSSPRSREIDFDNPPPWEDQSNNTNYKVKLMCSYGGKIHPRPHDNQLAYIGGETKILAVDRNIKFTALVNKLSAITDADVNFKYQLPGEDLDALRIFLFPVPVQNPVISPAHSFSSIEGRSDRDRFVEALNTGPVPVQSSTPAAPVAKVREFLDVDPDGTDRIQKHIQDLRRQTDKVVTTGLAGSVPAPVSGYQMSGGFPGSTGVGDQQPVYMVPASGGVYHAPMPRPVTGPIEGIRMVQSTVGMTDQGYGQVAYDNGAGRHVYYTPQGAMYQAMGGGLGTLSQDGKVIAPTKNSQG
ncbi:Phox/Bem1p [Artemisia annua]|uniref:Phox/Bem1p n=1 Tax=Artemisia annua TaxID=35608 RepID=A0A2U1M2G5_ARTAN|nr:Phox/Bem1p [Artemisia annua]